MTNKDPITACAALGKYCTWMSPCSKSEKKRLMSTGYIFMTKYKRILGNKIFCAVFSIHCISGTLLWKKLKISKKDDFKKSKLKKKNV